MEVASVCLHIGFEQLQSWHGKGTRWRFKQNGNTNQSSERQPGYLVVQTVRHENSISFNVSNVISAATSRWASTPGFRHLSTNCPAAVSIAWVNWETVRRENNGASARRCASQRAPLNAQEAIGKACDENATLDRVLRIVCGMIHENALDGRGVMDQIRVGEWEADPCDRLLEEVRAPALQRISLQPHE